MQRVNVVVSDSIFSLHDAISGQFIIGGFKKLHLAVRYANEHSLIANVFAPVCADVNSLKNKRNIKRFASFFDANGFPKKVRVYDDGGQSIDRFTICYFGNYRKTTAGDYYALGANFHPTQPQGFGQHLPSREPYDRPRSSHLGCRIRFNELPTEVQDWVIRDYADFWGFSELEFISK